MNALLLVAILRFAGDDPEFFGKPVFAWRADLDSRETAVRLRALTVLSEVDRAIPGAVEGLHAGLGDPDPFLRHLAVRALIAGGVDGKTRELIVRLVDDPDPDVKREARKLKGAPERPFAGEVFKVDPIPVLRSIVYVFDGSLSMRESDDSAKAELRKSISRLNATQRVLVLVFRDGDVETLVEGPATPELKQAVFGKLEELEFSGTSDPRAALRRAMEAKTDDGRPSGWINIITDGDLDEAALEEITLLNHAGGKPRARINAVVFADEDSAGHLTMKRFIEANGGSVRARGGN